MKKLRSISIKCLAIFLSIVTVVLSFPLAVLAQDSTVSDVADEIAEENIFELIDQRTESAKYFRLDDGSYVVAQYDTAVHYLDESSTWQDIDNTLSVSGSEITTSNAKIKFAKKTGGNGSLFTLHDGNRKLTLSLDGAKKKVAGTVTNHGAEEDNTLTKLQKMTSLEKISASVKYKDILDDVDLEYVINGLNVKENIIVKSKQEGYTYSFTMSLNNLTATQTEMGEIEISDVQSGEAVYLIPAPVMWDANMVHSNAVTMGLTDLGNGKYTLIVTADPTWINADDRVFPVTIDPPLYASYSSSATVTDWYEGGGDYNASTTLLKINENFTTYWCIDELPPLPASAYITNAEFSMQCNTTGVTLGYVSIMKPGDTVYTDVQMVEIDSGTDNSRHKWNILPIAKSWYSGTVQDSYNLKLAPATNTSFTGTAVYYSSRNTENDYKPSLTITYRDMKGIEDYWTYTTQSAGFAGTGSVNNATGNLVLSIPTLTTTDALMPITPTLVYNSALANKNYTSGNAQTPYATAYTPNGFKLNIQETLIKRSYVKDDGTSSYWFVWADGDGTEHYFMPNGTANTYADEDGLLLTLFHDTANAVCTITDIDKTVRTFSQMATSSAFCLTSITDKSGNKVTFTLDASYRPTAVNLVPNGRGAIEQLRLEYNTSGKLSAVWNPYSGYAVILGYGSNRLTSISHVHGQTGHTTWTSYYNAGVTTDATASYTYLTLGDLIGVANNLSKYKLEYNSFKGIISDVKEVEQIGTSSTGQEAVFTYGTGTTQVRTSGPDDEMAEFDIYMYSDDLLTTYVFDSQGRTISCYTTDGTKTHLYGASNGQYVGEENEKAKNNLKSSVQTTQQSPNYLLNGGFENGLTHWTKRGDVSVSTGDPYDGFSHASMTASYSSPTTYLYQEVALDKGEYTLTLNYSTTNTPDLPIEVTVQSLRRSSYKKTLILSKDENDATMGYVSNSITFEAEGGLDVNGDTETFRIKIEMIEDPDTAQTLKLDNLMLSRTTTAAEYDLVQGGHFENIGALMGTSSLWQLSGGTAIVDDGNLVFGEVLQMTGGIASYRNAKQVIYEATDDMREAYDFDELSQMEDSVFTVSGFGKGSWQCYGEDSRFGIVVYVEYYEDNTTVTEEVAYIPFDKAITGWQFVSGTFQGDPAKGLINKITVAVVYENNPGVACFNDISVIKNSSDTDRYEYSSENGLLQSYVSGDGTIDWYLYNADNTLSRHVNSRGTIEDYYYENNLVREIYHKVFAGIYSFAQNNVVNGTITQESFTRYTYDTFGLCIQVNHTPGTVAAGETMYSHTYYQTTAGSHLFGVVKEELDNLKRSTKYYYDSQTGRLLSVIYPDGKGVSYQYDDIGNLELVLPATVNTAGTGYSNVTDSASVDYAYDVTNRLSSIATESTIYTFVYDDFGNTTNISAGDHTLASYEYNDYNGKLSVLTYGNGLKVKYLYDDIDRITEICYNTGVNGAYETAYSYVYHTSGALASVTDHINNETTVYKYNTAGQLIYSYVADNAEGVNMVGTALTYNEKSQLVRSYCTYDTVASGNTVLDSLNQWYFYCANGNLDELSIMDAGGLDMTVNPEYDVYGRTTYKAVSVNLDNVSKFYNWVGYSYATTTGTSSTTTLVSGQVSQFVSRVGTAYYSINKATTYNYTYDANGNITRITDANGVIQYQYAYDDLGQLIREDNREKNASYEYIYDNAGNILAKKTYAFTTGTLGTATSTESYTYSSSTWGDLLTKYGTDTILYDAIGNPTKIGYYFSDEDYWGSGYDLQWQGRQLTSYQYFYELGGEYFYENSLTFTYNADGIRTSKTVDGLKHEYVLNGSQILYETWRLVGVEHILVYLYDEIGAPIGLKYRNSTYAANDYDYFFFEKNLQGDIVAVYNESCVRIGTYTYDAWGVCTASVTSGITSLESKIVNTYNPFRYRGYYYDVEIGLYYLQSRYYNPAWGRFLNADGVACLGTNSDLQAYNLFAYCSNNPVMNIDPTGTFNWKNLVVSVVAVALITTACVITAGAAAAAIGVSVATVTTATAMGGVVAGGLAIADQIIENGEVTDVGAVMADTFVGATSEAIDKLIMLKVPNSSKNLKTFAKIASNVLQGSIEIGINTMKNASGNRNWSESFESASRETIIYTGLKEGLDYAFFPNATDILYNTAKLLLPEEG